MRKPYPDDISDTEWSLIEPVLNACMIKQGRKAKHPRREILNAIFYVLRTGCQWRHLPHDFPPWGSVYLQFWRWKKKGVFQEIHHYVRRGLRQLLGRDEEPSAAIIDSQSVKTTERGAFEVSMVAKKLKAENGTHSLIQKGLS